MRSAGLLFQPPKPSAAADAKTADGMPAFTRPIEEQLLQALLTNTVGDTFYAGKNELLDETKRIHAAALDHNVVFYANALAYARTRGLMRLQPIYGLANLAANSAKDPAIRREPLVDAKSGFYAVRSHFELVFGEVIRTPNDLADFHTILRSMKNGTDGGRRVKRVAGAWLAQNLSEYWAIKYGANKTGAFSLRDLFRIYHPRDVAHDLASWLVDEPVVVLNGIPQIAAFETLKRAKTSAEKVKAITEGRLPHEVATSFAGKDKDVWRAIVPQLPAFALLRHLATIERAGIMPDVRDQVVAKFTDPRIANAKIFPFNFLKAEPHVQDGAVKDALRVAMELCLNTAETVPGRNFIALDVSGSMQDMIREAAMFAVATARRSRDSTFVTFNTEVQVRSISRVDSVMTQANAIRADGGTDHGKIGDVLLAARREYDNVIVVTDEQSNRGDPFADRIAEYRKRVARDAKVFVVNLAPYTANGGLMPAGPLNHVVFGLTENSIQYLAKAAGGWGRFVDEVCSGAAPAADVIDE